MMGVMYSYYTGQSTRGMSDYILARRIHQLNYIRKQEAEAKGSAINLFGL